MDKWAWHRHEVSHTPIKKENPARSGLIAIDVVISPLLKKALADLKKKPADMLKRRLKKKEYLIFCDLKMKKAQQHLTMRSKTYRLKKHIDMKSKE